MHLRIRKASLGSKFRQVAWPYLMVTRTDKNSYKWWQGGWRLQQWWGQGHYNSRLLTETWLPCQYAKQTGGSIDPKKSSHVPHHLLHLRRRRRPHLRSGFSFERSTLLMKYRLKQETRKPVKSSNMLILSITLTFSPHPYHRPLSLPISMLWRSYVRSLLNLSQLPTDLS